MSDIIEPVAQEETDLVLHSRLCAQRYQQITDRIDNLTAKLDNVVATVKEIRVLVTTKEDQNLKRYLQWAG